MLNVLNQNFLKDGLLYRLKQNYLVMLGIFKKKSPTSALEKKYRKLLKEAYDLSKVNRTESDRKQAEAQEILEKIESLRKD